MCIEAGFFLLTNECRVAPAIAQPGFPALFEPGVPNPEIQLVAFKADAQKELATLVGLEEVKNEIRLLIDFLKIQVARERHGIPHTPTR